jgi:hypothetical protein
MRGDLARRHFFLGNDWNPGSQASKGREDHQFGSTVRLGYWRRVVLRLDVEPAPDDLQDRRTRLSRRLA